MARVAVTPTTAFSPYASGPGAGVAEKAADASEFNSFANDGETYLIVRNKNAATKTLKFKSVDGTQIGATVTVPAEKSIIAGPFPVFEQFGSTVNIDGNHADLLFTVVSIPDRLTATR